MSTCMVHSGISEYGFAKVEVLQVEEGVPGCTMVHWYVRVRFCKGRSSLVGGRACTRVYHGVPWCTRVQHGVPECTMVYQGVACYTLVYHSMVLQRQKQSCRWKSVYQGVPWCTIHADVYSTVPVLVTAVLLKMIPRVRNMVMQQVLCKLKQYLVLKKMHFFWFTSYGYITMHGAKT